MKLFLRSEKRMRNGDGAEWAKFQDSINEWKERGFAEVLDASDRTPGFVIPAFIVSREDKNTTKFRLILNGAFTFNGKSLNDFLLCGPNVMNDLCEVLMRFRYPKYVITLQKCF